jgi:hypothetical protein
MAADSWASRHSLLKSNGQKKQGGAQAYLIQSSNLQAKHPIELICRAF